VKKKSDAPHPLLFGETMNVYDWTPQPVDVRDMARVLSMERESVNALAAAYLTVLRRQKEEKIGRRSPDYSAMTPQEQWEEDKRLGILDWEE